MKRSALPNRDLGRAHVHPYARLAVRDVLLDDRGLSAGAQRDHDVREGPQLRRLPRKEELDGPIDRDAVRHVDEGPAAQKRRRQGREPALVGTDRRAQQLLDQRRMLARGLRHRHDHHTTLGQIRVPLDQDRVGIQLHEERGAFLGRPQLAPKRRRQLGRAGDDGMGLAAREQVVPLEGADVGAPPELFRARGKGSLLGMRPRGGATAGQERRLLGALRQRGDLIGIQAAHAELIGPRRRQGFGWIHAWFSMGSGHAMPGRSGD